jgi:hypothetical protein
MEGVRFAVGPVERSGDAFHNRVGLERTTEGCCTGISRYLAKMGACGVTAYVQDCRIEVKGDG